MAMDANDNDALVVSVVRANKSLVEATAQDAASYSQNFHRNRNNIKVLHRAMRTYTTFSRADRVLFLQRWQELINE